MNRPDKAALAAELKQRTKEALELSNSIEPLLKGKAPDVQGATLANLLAIWLSGFHPPEVRGLMLRMHMGQVLDMAKMISMQRGE